jgi:5-hydroxyisourate hydrolase
VPVRLQRRSVDDTWETIAEAVTDADGGAGSLAEADTGDYRLTFDIDAYTPHSEHEGTQKAGFFPEISVTFRVAQAGAQHHVPLLLSPFAYSVYRGS